MACVPLCEFHGLHDERCVLLLDDALDAIHLHDARSCGSPRPELTRPLKVEQRQAGMVKLIPSSVCFPLRSGGPMPTVVQMVGGVGGVRHMHSSWRKHFIDQGERHGACTLPADLGGCHFHPGHPFCSFLGAEEWQERWEK